MSDGAEAKRIEAEGNANVAWKKWGPYLSERHWGTVREDYSEDGNAWEYFTNRPQTSFSRLLKRGTCHHAEPVRSISNGPERSEGV